MSSTDYKPLRDDTSRHVSCPPVRKLLCSFLLVFGLTSIPLLPKSSHNYLRTDERAVVRTVEPSILASSTSNLAEFKSSNISLNQLNDLIRYKGVLIHSFSLFEEKKTFKAQVHPNFGYFNMKSMCFAKGNLPYAPNFAGLRKLMKDSIPEDPNVAIIVDPNDKDVEIVSWKNHDSQSGNDLQHQVPLTMDEKCEVVTRLAKLYNLIQDGIHINGIFKECEGVKEWQTFVAFNGSKIDPDSYNGRYDYQKYLSENAGSFNGGLNLVNFFPKNMTGLNVDTSLWNEVLASFPPSSVKAIVYEDTEQGQKDAKRLQKLLPGHTPLFAFHTVGMHAH